MTIGLWSRSVRWVLAANTAQLLLAAALLALSAATVDAEPRHVLLLQSLERGNVVLDDFTSTLRTVMEDRSSEPLTFTELVVSPPGFRTIPEQAIVDFLRSAYGDGPKPDLVISTG